MRIKKPSLAQKLLQELLPLTAVILVLGGGLAYYVAHRAATVAYDRALMDSALALAAHVDVADGQLHMQLPEVAKDILLTDTYDQIFFEVVDAQGKMIAGDNGLPLPAQSVENDNPYYDGRFNGKRIRIAALVHEYRGTVVSG